MTAINTESIKQINEANVQVLLALAPLNNHPKNITMKTTSNIMAEKIPPDTVFTQAQSENKSLRSLLVGVE